MRAHLFVLLVAAVAATGCARWKPQQIVHNSEIIREVPAGSPYVEESTQTRETVDESRKRRTDSKGRPVTDTRETGTTTTIRRERCLQRFERTTIVDYDVDYRLRNVGWDYALGSIFAGLGTLIVVGDIAQSQSDPARDISPGAMTVGGIAIGGGLAMIIHGIVQQNSAKPPGSRGLTREDTRVVTLDSYGCPGFGGTPESSEPPPSDVAQRLKELKELRDSGVITEAEYQKKRKALADQL